MKNIENKIIETIMATLDVDKIILFGSRARGDSQQRADVDIAVACPNATPGDWLKLWYAIEDLESLLFIDLTRLDSASAALKDKIIREGIIIYERSKNTAVTAQS